jgi:hypothetical protein
MFMGLVSDLITGDDKVLTCLLAKGLSDLGLTQPVEEDAVVILFDVIGLGYDIPLELGAVIYPVTVYDDVREAGGGGWYVVGWYHLNEVEAADITHEVTLSHVF